MDYLGVKVLFLLENDTEIAHVYSDLGHISILFRSHNSISHENPSRQPQLEQKASFHGMGGQLSHKAQSCLMQDEK